MRALVMAAVVVVVLSVGAASGQGCPTLCCTCEKDRSPDAYCKEDPWNFFGYVGCQVTSEPEGTIIGPQLPHCTYGIQCFDADNRLPARTGRAIELLAELMPDVDERARFECQVDGMAVDEVRRSYEETARRLVQSRYRPGFQITAPGETDTQRP